MTVTMTQKNGDVLVVYFTEGKILDESVITQLGNELMATVDKSEHSQLLLNFNDVKFLSSAVLGKLVMLNKKCANEKVALKLCNIRPEIMEVFKITRLDKVFDIQKDESSAISSFEKKKWFLGK